jgi:hypothetical protein
VRIDQLNGPDAIIAGFGPELFGRPLDDGDVVRQDVVSKQVRALRACCVRPPCVLASSAARRARAPPRAALEAKRAYHHALLMCMRHQPPNPPQTAHQQGVPYYEWEVKPHSLVSATAVGNRVFLLNVSAKSSRSWQKTRDLLRVVQGSFFVPAPKQA